jgi:hypothetical protein
MRVMPVIALCLAASAAAIAQHVLTPQLADAFAKKVVAVQANASVAAKKPRPTTFTEAETNSYLKFNAGALLPTGLTEPTITMHGQGRVTGRAVIDLDIVRQKQSSGGWLDPTSYMTGKLPVVAIGKIVTADGTGRVEFERAEISGLPLSKSLLSQMVNYFTRTADNPKGSTIDDTFELPAKIRSIDVAAAGRFAVIQ